MHKKKGSTKIIYKGHRKSTPRQYLSGGDSCTKSTPVNITIFFHCCPSHHCAFMRIQYMYIEPFLHPVCLSKLVVSLSVKLKLFIFLH